MINKFNLLFTIFIIILIFYILKQKKPNTICLEGFNDPNTNPNTNTNQLQDNKYKESLDKKELKKNIKYTIKDPTKLTNSLKNILQKYNFNKVDYDSGDWELYLPSGSIMMKLN